MPASSPPAQTEYDLEQWWGSRWVRIRCIKAEDDEHALDAAEDYIHLRVGDHPGPYRLVIVTDYFTFDRGTAIKTDMPFFNPD